MAEHATGWWIRGDGAQELSSSLRRDISDSELGDGSVEIAVSHSAVNYKDAMALQGSRGVVRNTPLIPGIDAVGRVLSSGDPTLTPGETVILTGWGYGERRHGGLATRMRADPEHLIVLPEGLSPHQAATLGTAGFTAGLAVARLRAAGVSPDSSALPIAVTGAAGAVGSFAVFLLAKAGFPVTAITGRTDEASYLRALGASDVVSRQEILTHSGKAIGSEKYAGVIDQAGGPLLATLLSLTASEGVVVSCGLAGGSDLPTTVLPFILRGISLLGVNSVTQPTGNRVEAWNHWAALADSVPFDDISHTIGLAEAGEIAPRVLAGATRGRVVVEIGA